MLTNCTSKKINQIKKKQINTTKLTYFDENDFKRQL